MSSGENGPPREDQAASAAVQRMSFVDYDLSAICPGARYTVGRLVDRPGVHDRGLNRRVRPYDRAAAVGCSVVSHSQSNQSRSVMLVMYSVMIVFALISATSAGLNSCLTSTAEDRGSRWDWTITLLAMVNCFVITGLFFHDVYFPRIAQNTMHSIPYSLTELVCGIVLPPAVIGYVAGELVRDRDSPRRLILNPMALKINFAIVLVLVSILLFTSWLERYMGWYVP